MRVDSLVEEFLSTVVDVEPAEVELQLNSFITKKICGCEVEEANSLAYSIIDGVNDFIELDEQQVVYH